MKKLYFNNFLGLITIFFLVLIFFLPNAAQGKFPIPADALLNLYHPFRDISLDGYNPGKFPAKNTLTTDPVLQTYPWRYTVISSLKSGTLPLWNPYSFSGQPLMANIQSATFQITNLLFVVLPFNYSWVLQIIIPEILLGLFTFLYLRLGLNLSVAASAFGGFVMPFTGFFVAWMTWGTIVTTAMWLPLILLSIEKLFKKTFLWWIILILALSQTIFAGHWQTALYVFGASIIYLIFKTIKYRDYKIFGLIIFSFIISLLVAAIQILPSLEFLKYSARNIDQGFTPERQDWFLPFQNLTQLVAPDFFGNPTTGNYWGIWNYGEFVSFIGIVPLFLAIFAILKRKKETVFFIFLALISLILALPNPISKVPYLLNLPFIASLQPSRIIFLLDFSLVILAAFGFEFLMEEKKLKKILLSVAVIIVIIIAIVSVPILGRNIFPIVNHLDTSSITLRNLIFPVIVSMSLILIVLVKKFTSKKLYLIAIIFLLSVFELFRFAYKFTPFSKLNWIFPPTQTLRFLQNQEKPFRIITTDRRILHPNSSTVFGIESIDGYDPLYTETYSKYISVLQSSDPKSPPSSFNRIITPQKFDSVFTNLLNAKYILTFDDINNPNFVKVFQEGETKTYLNKRALPRFFFVSEVSKEPSDTQELATILAKGFDVSMQATSQGFSFPKQSINAVAKINSYNNELISIKTSLDKEAPLVLTNIYYPGWKGLIDGKEVKINKVDFMFQSVLVPAGDHVVDFVYKPDSFYNGLYLTLAGLGVSIAYLLVLWRKKYLS